MSDQRCHTIGQLAALNNRRAPRSQPFPLPGPFQEFEEARRQMLKKWLRWTADHPDSATISAELEGTIGALSGIAATASALKPPAAP